MSFFEELKKNPEFARLQNYVREKYGRTLRKSWLMARTKDELIAIVEERDQEVEHLKELVAQHKSNHEVCKAKLVNLEIKLKEKRGQKKSSPKVKKKPK